MSTHAGFLFYLFFVIESACERVDTHWIQSPHTHTRMSKCHPWIHCKIRNWRNRQHIVSCDEKPVHVVVRTYEYKNDDLLCPLRCQLLQFSLSNVGRCPFKCCLTTLFPYQPYSVHALSHPFQRGYDEFIETWNLRRNRREQKISMIASCSTIWSRNTQKEWETTTTFDTHTHLLAEENNWIQNGCDVSVCSTMDEMVRQYVLRVE